MALFGVCTGLTAAADRYEDRSDFKRAVFALETGRTSEFKRLKRDLEDYPLAPYLEYFEALRRISSIDPGEARDLQEQWDGTPLRRRFFRAWLMAQARAGRWTRYLEHYDNDSDTRARCYYLRALYKSGRRAEALDQVAPLWTVGTSQEKACDPLFEAWLAAGRLDEETAWNRLHLALQNNSVTLARYLLRFFSEPLRTTASRYIEVHTRPRNVADLARFPDDDYGRQAVVHGLVRYAAREPEKAMRLWPRAELRFDFADYQRAHALQNLVLAMAEQGSLPASADPSFAATVIEGIADAAIAHGRSDVARDWIEALPENERTKVKWRYWLGRSQLELDDETGFDRLAQLASQRTYYGFLAAHELGIEPSLNEQRPTAEPFLLATNPTVVRLTELYAVNDLSNARREWLFLTSQLGDGEAGSLVELLSRMGWTDLAIIAANRADLNDLLEIRFPTPFLHSFQRHAFQTGVPVNFLLAVARQESAFNPVAISSAGARGVMQMMIGTAQDTASAMRERKPSKASLLDPMVNIKLGSHHVAELSAKYQNHRALVAAAYNAGQYRVDRWIREARGVPTVVWVEQIPFRETRNYVKNVIAFSYVYAARLGMPQPVWGAHEQTIP